MLCNVFFPQPRPGDAETVAAVLDVGLAPFQPFRVDVRKEQLFVRGQGNARRGTVALGELSRTTWRGRWRKRCASSPARLQPTPPLTRCAWVVSVTRTGWENESRTDEKSIGNMLMTCSSPAMSPPDAWHRYDQRFVRTLLALDGASGALPQPPSAIAFLTNWAPTLPAFSSTSSRHLCLLPRPAWPCACTRGTTCGFFPPPVP